MVMIEVATSISVYFNVSIVVICTHSVPQFHRSGSLVLWDGMGAQHYNIREIIEGTNTYSKNKILRTILQAPAPLSRQI